MHARFVNRKRQGTFADILYHIFLVCEQVFSFLDIMSKEMVQMFVDSKRLLTVFKDFTFTNLIMAIL